MRGELFSSKVSIRKRTYFFNVKENRNSNLFLNIVESKKNEDGQFERHSIVVFQEDLDKFLEFLQKSVDFLNENEPESTT